MTEHTLPSLSAAIAIGIGATIVMDIWGAALKSIGIKGLDYAMVGRWIGHIPRGKLLHKGIGKSAPIPYEKPLGWMAHYAIGILFGVAFLYLQSGSWLNAPTMAPALTFGLVTVIFPFCIMQPCLGVGVAASKAPKPWLARLKSLTTHAIFGLGLYISAILLNTVL